MSSWPQARFGDLVQLVRRPVIIDPDVAYPEVGVRSFGRGTFHKPAVMGSQLQRDTFEVKSGDLIINLTFAWEGAVAIARPDDDGRYASHRFYTFRPRTAEVCLPFLCAYWASKWGIERLRAISPGGAGRNRVLSLRRLLEELVPLPSMSEQLRIVARLDSVAEKVRRVTKLVREVDADILQANRNIIWRAGLRRNSWQECRSFLTQRKPDVSVQSETEYQFAGVYSFGRGVFKADRKLGSTFKYSQLSRISAGDFIFPKLMAWEGALGVVPPECDGMVVSPEFPVFEIDTKVVSPDIVDTFFRDPRALPMLKDASTGTNMRRRRIQPSRFLELKMPIPSAGEQRLVRALLERRQLVIDRHEPNLGLLDRILPSMLHEAFAA